LELELKSLRTIALPALSSTMRSTSQQTQRPTHSLSASMARAAFNSDCIPAPPGAWPRPE
jgi:hypothetical protein